MERITEEKELCIKYGLKNKTELWKVKTELGRIRTQAKKLLVLSGEEADKERNELMGRLNKLGITVNQIDDVLGMDVSNLLERRLQTVVLRKGLANTPKQARQFIIHNHIWVGKHRVTVPSYMVLSSEEDNIRLTDKMQVVK